MVTHPYLSFASVRDYYDWICHLRRSLSRAQSNQDQFMVRHYKIVLGEELISGNRKLAAAALWSVAHKSVGGN